MGQQTIHHSSRIHPCHCQMHPSAADQMIHSIPRRSPSHHSLGHHVCVWHTWTCASSSSAQQHVERTWTQTPSHPAAMTSCTHPHRQQCHSRCASLRQHCPCCGDAVHASMQAPCCHTCQLHRCHAVQ